MWRRISCKRFEFYFSFTEHFVVVKMPVKTFEKSVRCAPLNRIEKIINGNSVSLSSVAFIDIYVIAGRLCQP